jgi:hypothetical protein
LGFGFVPASIIFASLLKWPRSLMDRASDYGSEGCRFESYRGHKTKIYNFKNAGNHLIIGILHFTKSKSDP